MGTCPSHDFLIDGVTAHGQVALLYAFSTGSYPIPAGYPCAGTALGLDSTVTLGAMLRADATGSASLHAIVPTAACGRITFQALDLATCGLSPAVLLP